MSDANSVASSLTSNSGSTLRLIASENAMRNQSIPAGQSEPYVRESNRNVTFADLHDIPESVEESDADAFDFNYFTGQFMSETFRPLSAPVPRTILVEDEMDAIEQISLQASDELAPINGSDNEPRRRMSITAPPKENRVAELRRVMAARRAEKVAAAEALAQKPKVLPVDAERQQRLARLAVPIAGKFEAPPQPPKLSTDCPDLPASGIDEIQSKSTDYRQGPFMKLPVATTRLRWTISALVDKHWNQSHQDTLSQEYSYTRSDVCRNESLQFSGPLLEPGELRRRLFAPTIDLDGNTAGSFIVSPASANSDSKNYAVRQLRSFLKTFKMGFICLVLDMQMQVIGTYDPSLGQYLPGVTLGPDYLQNNRIPQSNDANRANLLDINLEDLPGNVFAVVPVLMDESSNVSRTELVKETSTKRSLFQDMKFQIQSFSYSLKTDAEKAEGGLSVSAAAESDGDVAGGAGGGAGTMTHGTMNEPPEEHVLSLIDGLIVETNHRGDDGNNEDISSVQSEPKGDSDVPSDIQAKLRQLRKHRKARTPEEEEQWLRQSWSLDVPNNEKPNTAVAAVHITSQLQSQQLQSSQSTAAAAPDSCATSIIKGADTSTLQLQPPRPVPQQSSSAPTATAPSPSSQRSPASSRRVSLRGATAPIIIEEPKKPLPRWHQVSLTEIGRMLPTQLRALFRETSSAEDEDDDDEGSVGEPAQKEDTSGWRSCNAVFGIGDAFAPVVIFRRSAFAGGWAMKPLNLRLPRCGQQIDVALKTLLAGLVSNYIVPFHVIHVEHCRNCEDHQWTTWHQPGSYEKAYRDFRHQIKKRLPPCLILSNLPHISSAPRVGSFEVLIRPYFSTVTRSMHSKLQSNKFPDYGELVEELSPQMLPAIVRFDGIRPVLEVLAFDAVTRKPISGAEVTIYRLNITILMAHENLEGSKSSHRSSSSAVPDDDANEELENKSNAAALSSNAEDEKPQHSDGDRPAPKPGSSSSKKEKETSGDEHKKNSSKRSITLPKRKSIIAISRDGRKKSIVASKDGDNDSDDDDDDARQVGDDDTKLAKKDLAIRQTQAYKNICTWTKFDVAAWFREFGAAPDVLANATVEGVVDGPSFCKLVTLDALKKWGVRSKRTLRKLEEGLKFINQGEGSEEANRLIKEFAMSVGAVGIGIDALSGAGGAATSAALQKDTSGSGKKTLGYGAVAASSALWLTSAGIVFGSDIVGKVNDDGLNYNKDLEITDSSHASTQRHHAVTTQFRQQLRSLGGGGRDPMEYQAVFRGRSSETGLCRAKIPISGTYIIKISTRAHVAYSSNAIRLNEAERVLYAAALRPAIVPTILYAIIKLPTDDPPAPTPPPPPSANSDVAEGVSVEMQSTNAVSVLVGNDHGVTEGGAILSRKSEVTFQDHHPSSSSAAAAARSLEDSGTTINDRDGRGGRVSRRVSAKSGASSSYQESLGSAGGKRNKPLTSSSSYIRPTTTTDQLTVTDGDTSAAAAAAVAVADSIDAADGTDTDLLVPAQPPQPVKSLAEELSFPKYGCLTALVHLPTGRRYLVCMRLAKDIEVVEIIMPPTVETVDPTQGGAVTATAPSSSDNQIAAAATALVPAAAPVPAPSALTVPGMNMGYLNFEVPKNNMSAPDHRGGERDRDQATGDDDEEEEARRARRKRQKLRKKMNNSYMFGGDSDDEGTQQQVEEPPEPVVVIVEPPKPQEIVHTTRLCARELRLPGGPYLSEVDGSVIQIHRQTTTASSSSSSLSQKSVTKALLSLTDNDDDDNDSSLTVADKMLAKVKAALDDRFPSMKSYVNHDEAVVLRCHRRLLRHAVIIFQRIIRGKLAVNMARRLKLIRRIWKHAPGFMDHVRGIVKQRLARFLQRVLRGAVLRKKFLRSVSAAIIIQSLARMHRVCLIANYYRQANAAVVLQRMVRGYLARHKIRVWHCKARVLTNFVRRFIRVLGWRKFEAVIIIECAYRAYRARVLRHRKVVAQHGLTLVVFFIRFLWRCRRGYTRAREREYRENISMHHEEERSIGQWEYDAKLIAEEKHRARQRAEMKLRQIEAKKIADLLRKGKLLVRVQALYRGYICRKRVRNARKSIVKVQNLYRRRVCMRKLTRIKKLMGLGGAASKQPKTHNQNHNMFSPSSSSSSAVPSAGGGGGGGGASTMRSMAGGLANFLSRPSSAVVVSREVGYQRQPQVSTSAEVKQRDLSDDSMLPAPRSSAVMSTLLLRRQSSQTSDGNSLRRNLSLGMVIAPAAPAVATDPTDPHVAASGSLTSSRMPSMLRKTISEQFAATLPPLLSEKADDQSVSATKIQSFVRMTIARRKYRIVRGTYTTGELPIDPETRDQLCPPIKMSSEPEIKKDDASSPLLGAVATARRRLSSQGVNNSSSQGVNNSSSQGVNNSSSQGINKSSSQGVNNSSIQGGSYLRQTISGAWQNTTTALMGASPSKSVGATVTSSLSGLVPRRSAIADAPLLQGIRGFLLARRTGASRLAGSVTSLLRRRSKTSSAGEDVSDIGDGATAAAANTAATAAAAAAVAIPLDRDRAAALIQAAVRGAMSRTRLYQQPEARLVFEKIIFGTTNLPTVTPIKEEAEAEEEEEEEAGRRTPRTTTTMVASDLRAIGEEEEEEGGGGGGSVAVTDLSPIRPPGKSLFISPPPSELKPAAAATITAVVSEEQAPEISVIRGEDSELKLRRSSLRGRRASRASAHSKAAPIIIIGNEPSLSSSPAVQRATNDNNTTPLRNASAVVGAFGTPNARPTGGGIHLSTGGGIPLSATRSRRSKASPVKTRVDDYLERPTAQRDRATRRKLNDVGLCDAVLHIVGGVSNELPKVDFEWYLGVHFMGDEERTHRQRNNKGVSRARDKLSLEPYVLAPVTPAAAKTPSKFHPIPTEIDGVKAAPTPKLGLSSTPLSTMARGTTRFDFEDSFALSHTMAFSPAATGGLLNSSAAGGGLTGFSPGATFTSATAGGFGNTGGTTWTQSTPHKPLHRPPPPAPQDMAMKSAVISSLSAHAYSSFNYAIHLTDLDRYFSMQLVLIVEAIVDEKVFLAPDSKANPLQPTRYGDIARPLGGFKIVQKKVKVSAFSGVVRIQQGMTFGPQGGRMNVTLLPNIKGISDIPSLRPLLSVEELHATVTLIPTARPSSTLLRMFRTVNHPAPCYPSVLVDAALLQESPFKWYAGYGMPLTAISYRDRLLMSVHKSSQTLSVAEYETNGKFVAKVCSVVDAMGPMHLMFSGYSHVLCCGSRGGVVALQLLAELPSTASHSRSSKDLPHDHNHHSKRKRGSRTDEDLQIHFRRLEDTEFEGEDRWSVPVPLRKHHNNQNFDPKRDIILGGCALASAGMDMFFTVNVVGAICVHILYRGEEVRSFFNPPFLHTHGKITAISVFGRSLYVGMQDGYVLVLGLQPVFEGHIEMLGHLGELIVRQDALYAVQMGDTPKAKSGSRRKLFSDEDKSSFSSTSADDFRRSVTCMAVMSANGFLGLRDEDEVIRTTTTTATASATTAIDPNRYNSSASPQPGYLTGVIPQVDPTAAYDHNSWGKDPAYVAATEELLRGDVVEGHLLLVAGNDGKSPCVKVLRPKLSGMTEIATLRGDQNAITHILTDAAGRHIILGSIGDRCISIFDGLTFKCERIIDDISIDSMTLALDTLLVINHKVPFIRAWSLSTGSEELSPADKQQHTTRASTRNREVREFGRNTSPLNTNKTLFNTKSFRRVNREVRKEDITSVRNTDWARALLKGAFPSTITETACVPTSQLAGSYRGEEAACVVARWTNQLLRIAPSSTSAEHVDWEKAPNADVYSSSSSSLSDSYSGDGDDDGNESDTRQRRRSYEEGDDDEYKYQYHADGGVSFDDFVVGKRMQQQRLAAAAAAVDNNSNNSNQDLRTFADVELAEVLKVRHRDVIRVKPYHMSDSDDDDNERAADPRHHHCSNGSGQRKRGGRAGGAGSSSTDVANRNDDHSNSNWNDELSDDSNYDDNNATATDGEDHRRPPAVRRGEREERHKEDGDHHAEAETEKRRKERENRERQKKLHPRMITHLNDAMMGSDSDEAEDGYEAGNNLIGGHLKGDSNRREGGGEEGNGDVIASAAEVGIVRSGRKESVYVNTTTDKLGGTSSKSRATEGGGGGPLVDPSHIDRLSSVTNHKLDYSDDNHNDDDDGDDDKDDDGDDDLKIVTSQQSHRLMNPKLFSKLSSISRSNSHHIIGRYAAATNTIDGSGYNSGDSDGRQEDYEYHDDDDEV